MAKRKSEKGTGIALEPLELNSEKYAVTIRLTSKMLATVPKDPDVYGSFIASKAPSQDEIDEEMKTVPEPQTKAEEKGWTGFHTDDKGIFIYNYMIKGHMKTALETLVSNGAVTKVPAYKKWIDRMVFISPRKIYFGIKQPDDSLSRPLRTMTPQGERVTLVKSDYVKQGREISFEIEVLKNDKNLDWKTIGKCLQYGEYIGLGQWRGSGGYGQFEVVKARKIQTLKAAA